jgi:hypothetical protein
MWDEMMISFEVCFFNNFLCSLTKDSFKEVVFNISLGKEGFEVMGMDWLKIRDFEFGAVSLLVSLSKTSSVLK